MTSRVIPLPNHARLAADNRMQRATITPIDTMPNDIAYGFCQCGCGERTAIIQRSHPRRGMRKGEPSRFLSGHYTRSLSPSPVRSAEYREDYAVIRLGDGSECIVDPDVPVWIGERRLSIRRPAGYVTLRIDGQTTYLHRALMSPPDGMLVDHINRNILDNRRANLRVATHAQNVVNQNRHRGTANKYRGVRQVRGRWVAQFSQVRLGSFGTEHEAALAYDAYVRDRCGEFAVCNLPDDDSPERLRADIRATRASLFQAKVCIAELVAAIRDAMPDHPILRELAPFIQPEPYQPPSTTGASPNSDGLTP